MSDDVLENELKREGFARIFAQEKLIEEATELVASTMQDCGMSKAQLAKRLGTSRAHITQLLRGSRNMTLRTLADIMHALNKEVMLVSTDRDDEDMPPACATGADASAPPGLRRWIEADPEGHTASPGPNEPNMVDADGSRRADPCVYGISHLSCAAKVGATWRGTWRGPRYSQ